MDTINTTESEENMRRILFLFLFLMNDVMSNEHYLGEHEDFSKILDVNREAESWGTCYAVYIMASYLYDEMPSMKKEFEGLSRGSKLSILMTYILDESNIEETSEDFPSAWNASKVFMQSVAEIRLNGVMSAGELLKSEDKQDVFLQRIVNTTEICAKNITMQQGYIDAWRKMARGPLLKIPNE